MPTALRVRRRRLLVVGLGAALLVPLSMSPAGAHGPSGSAAPTAGTTVVGTVIRASSDPTLADAQRNGKRARALTWIQPARGAAVRVPTEQVPQLPVGATVKARVGAPVTDAASTQDGLQAAHQVLAASVVAPAAPPRRAATATLPYTDTVTVVKVHPAGDSTTSDTTTTQSVIDQVNGPVADYWQSQTRGTVRLTAVQSSQAENWVTSTADCSNPQALFSDVSSQIGFSPGPGQHLLIYISADPSVDCGDGLGEVGASTTAGGSAYVKGQAHALDVLTSIITHELGHNFGLGHSSEKECDKSVENGACSVASYADMYDPMGYSWGQMGALNAQQAALVNGLPADEQQDLRGVAGTTTVTLSPMGTAGGTRSVRLRGPGGVDYWMEYRSAVGQDGWLGNPGTNDPALDQGVLLHIAGDGPRGPNGDTSLVLDATPSPRSGWDTDYQTALKAGRSVWLSGLDFYVTVKSTSATSATVRIQAGDGALSRDLDRNYATDLLAIDPSGVLYRYDSSGNGGFAGRVIMGRGWQTRDLVTMVGDWDGSGAAQDVVGRDSSGNLWLYTGAGRTAPFTSSRIIGRGWQIFSALVSPGDWNGDGNPDLLARRRSDNTLWLYPGNGAGGFLPPTQIGAGWGSMTSFEATGDFDLDGAPDFIVRRSDGALLLYRGNGRGGFDGGGQVVGSGWNMFSSITGVGDWNRDGIPDLLGRKPDGTMVFYAGTRDGHFVPGRAVGAGWGRFRMVV